MNRLKKLVILIKGHWIYGGYRGVARLILALLLLRYRTILTAIPRQSRWCPCCDWRGSTFLPYIAGGYVTFHASCPKCNSHERHRGHRLFYQRILHMERADGNVLYVAPDSPITFLETNPQLLIVTSNYDKPADLNIDLMYIPFGDKSWDFIICHRVLEHVADDYRAMSEIHRVLREDGIAILSVPFDRSRATTIEYGRPNPLVNDHYYHYGRDFLDRLASTFSVTTHDYSAMFSNREFEELALREDAVFVCRRRS